MQKENVTQTISSKNGVFHGDFHPMGSQSVKNHQQNKSKKIVGVFYWKFFKCIFLKTPWSSLEKELVNVSRKNTNKNTQIQRNGTTEKVHPPSPQKKTKKQTAGTWTRLHFFWESSSC